MRQFGVLLFFLLVGLTGKAQNLFLEECFVGGVTVAGRTSYTFINGKFKIRWNSNCSLKDAYVLTYRYGRPESKPFMVNNQNFIWDNTTQIGSEQIGSPIFNTEHFAVHVQKITDKLNLSNDSIIVYMDGSDTSVGELAKGWWSLDFVILYTAPSLIDTTCLRIYTASEEQFSSQQYIFEKPNYRQNTDVGFSIYSDRITQQYEDRTCIGLNSETLGCVWTPDATNPFEGGGVRGHFYFENGALYGLDDDTANTQVYKSDGIAIINNFLNDQSEQSLVLVPVSIENPSWGYNPHPAFFIVYTPDGCGLSTFEMSRAYSTCHYQSNPRGQPDQIDSLTFEAIPGYDHYDWTPGTAFNDSTLANPTLAADSSGWYRVRMWSDDPDGLCSQTIPVFLSVGAVPRPDKLKISQTSCPTATGRIEFKNMAGAPPFQYTVNGNTQSDSVFDYLKSGTYTLSVTDSLGCVWDSTVVITVNPVQQTAFSANPDSGYSPLRVVFQNESANSTTFQWLIDGELFSSNKNTFYIFPDSGSFEVALVAFSDDKVCSDTAYATITVFPGIDVIVPNIITPNNDGHNDNLVARVAGVASMQWQVFNRWGNLITSGEATDPAESVVLWIPGGGQVSAGVYTVALQLKGESGEVRKMVVQVEVVE